jgi:membrane protease YdiL (CAAX protease family)
MDRVGELLRALHLLFFGLLIPLISIRSRRALANRFLAPRKRQYWAMIVQLALFASFSMIVANSSGIEIFPPRLPSMRSAAAGLLFLVLAVLIMRPRWRQAVVERKRIVYFFMPSDRAERLMWIVASALAGFGEELTWRGVQTALLAALTGSTGAAIALCIAMFAVSHLQQGWKSVVIVVPFAAAFHLLVWLSGSLYVAMAVHFLYDAIAGFTYARLGRQWTMDNGQLTMRNGG